jgi:hypothetical protein
MPKYGTQGELERQFAWQARVGLGPKFGSMAIGPYQMDHMALVDEIDERCGRVTQTDPKQTAFDVELRGLNVQCRLGSDRCLTCTRGT